MIMSTTTKTSNPKGLDARAYFRIIAEGYGPGAWHGSDLKAALTDVSSGLAFWRPAAGRHSIAEIALHHTYCTRSVRGQLSGTPPEPFLLEGDDWFALSDQAKLTWPEIAAAVAAEQSRLSDTVAGIADGLVKSPLAEAERFNLILGITCHAIYHAGQVQLIKRLHAG
jgi:hypothetical protein